MLALMGYLLIVTFMVLLSTKRFTPFVGLIVVAAVFGMAVCVINGQSVLEVGQWIKEGLFYKYDADAGKVSNGTVNTAVLLLFAIIYFSLMLNAGLFDPLCIGILKMVKGDPLKITLATALIASVVALDGDGTTTVLIVTSAMLSLYKKMNMKLIYLAMLIVIPNSILNLLPWGGPLARVLSVLNLEVAQLLPPLVPGMIAAMAYVFLMAYWMGIKERKRLWYVDGCQKTITQQDIQGIIDEIKAKDKALKRPKHFWVNLILSLSIMVMLIRGDANGAVLFMVGTALALMINYPGLSMQRQRLIENGGDALSPVIIILAAGCLMGILNGSGMSQAIAENMVSWIPESWGRYIPALFAVVALPGLIFLSNDAFYFGILPVVAPIAYSYGATPENMGVAAMLGQALHFASPLVAFLYILIDRCEISFGEYQKAFIKWSWPVFIVYFVMAVMTGAMPL